MTIESKVIKAIAFGAGCLLGMRSCLIKKLPTDTEIPYINEMANHISGLFLAYGYAMDLDHTFNLRTQLLTHYPVALKMFLNSVFLLYAANREHMHFIWAHFKGKELNYSNFEAIKDHPSVKQFLLTCIECVKLLEEFVDIAPQRSTACANYLRSHSINQESFNYLLKAAIKMRLRSEMEGTTPVISSYAKRVYFAPGA